MFTAAGLCLGFGRLAFGAAIGNEPQAFPMHGCEGLM